MVRPPRIQNANQGLKGQAHSRREGAGREKVGAVEESAGCGADDFEVGAILLGGVEEGEADHAGGPVDDCVEGTTIEFEAVGEVGAEDFATIEGDDDGVAVAREGGLEGIGVDSHGKDKTDKSKESRTHRVGFSFAKFSVG